MDSRLSRHPTPNRTRILALLTLALLIVACDSHPVGAGETGAEPGRVPAAPLPACEWCGTGEAPEELSWRARIAPADEPGEPLVLEGTVYADDAQTPVPGVVIYAYHTDAEGIYDQRGDETGNGRRHGRLRAWVETGEDGRYHFDTIRPGAYPGRQEPQHVHLTIDPPGAEERWIDTVQFSDDPLLTAAQRSRAEGRGGSGIVTPRRDADGTWHARRDVLLDDVAAEEVRTWTAAGGPPGDD